MRLVSLTNIIGNELVACNITDVEGRMLLAQGMTVKKSYLNKLNTAGISAIYIEDEISEGIQIEQLLCDETKHTAKVAIETEMNRFFKKREIDFAFISKITNTIMDEILNNRTQLLSAKDIKLKDEYLFSHSVNVCAITVFLCAKLGMEQSRILSIGAGAMLHDFGKLLVSDEILKKEGSLTEEELAEVQSHPLLGYEALKEDITINPITKMVVYMHHEKMDGSGYPNSFSADKIHESARLVSVCNTFDSMSSDKVYRKAYSVPDVIEYLSSLSGMYFDKKFVDAFIKNVPMFPPGTVVLLSNGLVGIVMESNSSHLSRPLLRIIYNTKNKIKYGSNNYLDLMQDLSVKIEREIQYSP